MTPHCALEAEYKQAPVACELHAVLPTWLQVEICPLRGEQEKRKNTFLTSMNRKMESD